MKWLFSFMVTGFFLLSAWQSPFAISANPLVTNRLFIQASGSTPTILYAEWIGKNLQIEGTGFAAGATVLVNGQRLKTANNETYPNNYLSAKKAKKKVAPDQAIKLQVQNPDGEMSNEFTFYSGLTLTSSYQSIYESNPLHLHVGDVFLLYLQNFGEPPTFVWQYGFIGPPNIVAQLSEPRPIPKSQSFFQVNRPGQFELHAVASPQCPPLPIERCTISGAKDPSFDMLIIVQ